MIQKKMDLMVMFLTLSYVYDTIDVDDILDIRKYLMKKNDIV